MRILLSALTLLLLFSCSKKVAEAPETLTVSLAPIAGAAVLPDATVFRMSGDYARNVAITLNADGTPAYYPAPTDLTPESAPLPLEDGWYLNRQGLGSNSVFTSYTFEEYMALPSAPTRQELLESIIPGARVTSFRVLPVKMSDALADPKICLPYISKQQ